MIRKPAACLWSASWLAMTALLLASCSATPPAAAPAGNTAASSPPQTSAPETSTNPAPRDFKLLGRDDAPVTIIEFTDLQCPYCAAFALGPFPELRKRYIDTGKLRFASTDLPLPMHKFAVPAAVSARCAGEQGQYWEYRERLFEVQSQFAKSPFMAVARELGLDVDRFQACRQDGRQLQLVREDAARAAEFQISATPTFVIGRIVDGEFQGETLSGAQSFESLAARIDALLAAP